MGIFQRRLYRDFQDEESNSKPNMMRNMEDTMSEDELRKEKRIGFFLIVILLTFLSVLVLAYIKTAEENCIGLDVTCPDSKEPESNYKNENFQFSGDCSISIDMETYDQIEGDPRRITDMSINCNLETIK